MKPIHTVIITGLAGSGKSTAIHALEDLGYFCVDNLPVALLPTFLKLISNSQHPIDHVGLVMDVRASSFSSEAQPVFDEVRAAGHPLELLFLEANLQTLVRRFNETRRRHPLAPHGSIREGILKEIDELADLRQQANPIIDTSSLNVHDLKRRVQGLYNPDPDAKSSLTVNILSFGFKAGVPSEVDLLFDVRFLNNPYFKAELRLLSGKTSNVSSYVLNQPSAQTFLNQLFSLLNFLLPLYTAEGKTYLTIGIGCTGGQHRSVAIAHALAERLQPLPYRINVRHRDVRTEHDQ